MKIDFTFEAVNKFKPMQQKIINIGSKRELEKFTIEKKYLKNQTIKIKDIIGTEDHGHANDQRTWAELFKYHKRKLPSILMEYKDNPKYYNSKKNKNEWSFTKLNNKYYFIDGLHRTHMIKYLDCLKLINDGKLHGVDVYEIEYEDEIKEIIKQIVDYIIKLEKYKEFNYELVLDLKEKKIYGDNNIDYKKELGIAIINRNIKYEEYGGIGFHYQIIGKKELERFLEYLIRIEYIFSNKRKGFFKKLLNPTKQYQFPQPRSDYKEFNKLRQEQKLYDWDKKTHEKINLIS